MPANWTGSLEMRQGKSQMDEEESNLFGLITCIEVMLCKTTLFQCKFQYRKSLIKLQTMQKLNDLDFLTKVEIYIKFA